MRKVYSLRCKFPFTDSVFCEFINSNKTNKVNTIIISTVYVVLKNCIILIKVVKFYKKLHESF